VKTLTKDQDQLLTFFDFPAEHWIHLRITNPIGSTFATVKARTRKTKRAGPGKAGLAMAFKLLLAAEKRWRRVNAPHLVALVKAGVEFPNGQAAMLAEEPVSSDPQDSAISRSLSVLVSMITCPQRKKHGVPSSPNSVATTTSRSVPLPERFPTSALSEQPGRAIPCSASSS